jgi:hypothetical protein
MKREVALYLAGYLYFEVTKGYEVMVAANVHSKLRACPAAQQLSHPCARISLPRF